ncbi:hypothetical protein HHK36_010968 [Tetracentron sinense]|uniref:Uncharacterized protein n=1 Tax=Tetracentron sinense TaxID=13715 RepID=A0A834ZFB5_TETSI|nr:hypothetical protein HHK36_010968 [Tetracentron sinense]
MQEVGRKTRSSCFRKSPERENRRAEATVVDEDEAAGEGWIAGDEALVGRDRKPGDGASDEELSSLILLDCEEWWTPNTGESFAGEMDERERRESENFLLPKIGSLYTLADASVAVNSTYAGAATGSTVTAVQKSGGWFGFGFISDAMEVDLKAELNLKVHDIFLSSSGHTHSEKEKYIEKLDFAAKDTTMFICNARIPLCVLDFQCWRICNCAIFSYPFVEGRSSFSWEYGMGYFSAVAPGFGVCWLAAFDACYALWLRFLYPLIFPC